jgi:hypothetical protein
MHIKETAIREIYSKMIKLTLSTFITTVFTLTMLRLKEQLGKISKSMGEQLMRNTSKWS